MSYNKINLTISFSPQLNVEHTTMLNVVRKFNTEWEDFLNTGFYDVSSIGITPDIHIYLSWNSGLNRRRLEQTYRRNKTSPIWVYHCTRPFPQKLLLGTDNISKTLSAVKWIEDKAPPRIDLCQFDDIRILEVDFSLKLVRYAQSLHLERNAKRQQVMKADTNMVPTLIQLSVSAIQEFLKAATHALELTEATRNMSAKTNEVSERMLRLSIAMNQKRVELDKSNSTRNDYREALAHFEPTMSRLNSEMAEILVQSANEYDTRIGPIYNSMRDALSSISTFILSIAQNGRIPESTESIAINTVLRVLTDNLGIAATNTNTFATSTSILNHTPELIVSGKRLRQSLDSASNMLSSLEASSQETLSTLQECFIGDPSLKEERESIKKGMEIMIENLSKRDNLTIKELIKAATQTIAPSKKVSTMTTQEPTLSTQQNADDKWIRILHLSDFHFSEKTHWQSSKVLNRLSTDLKRFTERGLSPHRIVITGDIADWGLKNEYEIAEEWIRNKLLPATNAELSSIMIVPGNHDVVRSKIDEFILTLQSNLLSNADQSQLTRFLQGRHADTVMERHEHYFDFARRLGLPDTPWWASRETINNTEILFAGLNSAWMSSSPDDHGKLLLSEYQVNTLLSDADDADIVIGLLHHPWSYFAEWDNRVCLRELRRTCSVILRGHLHEVNIENRHSTHNQTIEIAAGCCYSNSDWPNSYQLVELNHSQNLVRTHLRVWQPSKQDWIPDQNEGGTNGIYQTSLLR